MKTVIVASLLLASICVRAEAEVNLPVADGPFKPEWESLKQYQCPDLFRAALLIRCGLKSHVVAEGRQVATGSRQCAGEVLASAAVNHNLLLK